MPRRSALALVALVALVVACGDGGPAAAPTEPTAAPSTAGSSTVHPATSTAAAVPQRIVSLSPSLTEMLFAVGAGGQVAAVDKYSDFPAGAPVTDLSGFKPNVEAIATGGDDGDERNEREGGATGHGSLSAGARRGRG